MNALMEQKIFYSTVTYEFIRHKEREKLVLQYGLRHITSIIAQLCLFFSNSVNNIYFVCNLS